MLALPGRQRRSGASAGLAGSASPQRPASQRPGVLSGASPLASPGVRKGSLPADVFQLLWWKTLLVFPPAQEAETVLHLRLPHFPIPASKSLQEKLLRINGPHRGFRCGRPVRPCRPQWADVPGDELTLHQEVLWGGTES